MTSYSALPNKLVSAPDGVDYAYRDAGQGELPLILLQHFRGNLDSWDPALVDDLAAARRVVAFDNAGVGGSTGTTPHTIEQMAHDAIAFITARRFSRADMLGFSIGSFVAQEIALIRPDLVRRVILARPRPPRARTASTGGPRRSSGRSASRRPAPRSTSACSSPRRRPAARRDRRRWGACTPGPRTGTRARSWAVREAQYDAVCAWGIPDHAALQRLAAIEQPVFVANGDSDPMIPPRYSHLIAGLLPDAAVKIYPDAAHGFLFQHHAEFAADVTEFLS